MANELMPSAVSAQAVAKRGLAEFENSMVMGNVVNRTYVNEFKKKGEYLQMRKPVPWVVTDAATLTTSDVKERWVTFQVSTQSHIGWFFTSKDLTMSIDQYNKRYVRPSSQALAAHVDKSLCSLYVDIGNSVGTPGTPPNSFSVLGDAQTLLDENACPAGRHAVFNPAANWAMADALKGTFAPKPANDILTKGYLGSIAGLDCHMDQMIQSHTCGNFVGTPLLSAAMANADYSIPIDGLTGTGTGVKAGDVFTLTDSTAAIPMNNCNPISKHDTGRSKYVPVANDETIAASAVTIDLDQELHKLYDKTSGKTEQNVHVTGDALSGIDNNGIVTFYGTAATGNYVQNLAFHPDAFGLVMVPMELPPSEWCARYTANNMSIRVVKFYDGANDKQYCRMDILFGVKTLNAGFACRIWG